MDNKEYLQRLLKRSALHILNNIQESTPEKRVFINLFNTGIVIDTLKVRNAILRDTKRILLAKKVRKRRKKT